MIRSGAPRYAARSLISFGACRRSGAQRLAKSLRQRDDDDRRGDTEQCTERDVVEIVDALGDPCDRDHRGERHRRPGEPGTPDRQSDGGSSTERERRVIRRQRPVSEAGIRRRSATLCTGAPGRRRASRPRSGRMRERHPRRPSRSVVGVPDDSTTCVPETRPSWLRAASVPRRRSARVRAFRRRWNGATACRARSRCRASESSAGGPRCRS